MEGNLLKSVNYSFPVCTETFGTRRIDEITLKRHGGRVRASHVSGCTTGHASSPLPIGVHLKHRKYAEQVVRILSGAPLCDLIAVTQPPTSKTKTKKVSRPLVVECQDEGKIINR